MDKQFIIDVIKREFDEEVTLETKLGDFLDSIETAELLMAIEDEMGITVPGDLRITGDTTAEELAKMMKDLK